MLQAEGLWLTGLREEGPLQSGHFLPGATGEWCHGSEQRRWLGGNGKDGHLGEQSGNGAAREPPLRGREMGRIESITTNKASGGDGIPVELFQILKDDFV